MGRATLSGWNWLVEVSNHAGAIALVLLAIGVSLFSAVKLPHWWLGALILLGFYVLLFGEGSFRVWREADAAASATLDGPRARWIEFGTPFRAEPRALHRQTAQGTRVGSAFTPIVLPVHARGGTVVNCRSTVEFKARDFEKGMRGRWENHGEPKRIYGEDISYLDRITLLKDEDEAIAIAVQHETDPHIYMLCNLSWEGFLHLSREDFRNQQYTLPNSPVSVRVTVRGDDVDHCSYEFMLVQGDGYQWRPVFEDEIGNPLVPFADAGGATPPERDREREADLQKIRLVRGEIDTGRQIVERAIGVSQVYETVPNDYWVGHRNEIAAVPEAGDAHRLCVASWDGFDRYNRVVNKREFISDDDLRAMAKTAMQASDSLGVADQAVSKRP